MTTIYVKKMDTNREIIFRLRSNRFQPRGLIKYETMSEPKKKQKENEN